MQKWICTVCKYVYDPELGDPDHGVPPGTRVTQAEVRDERHSHGSGI